MSHEGRQSTLSRSVVCRGIGLHSGESVELRLHPGEASSGIVFVSLASDGGRSHVEIPATLDAVASSSRATTLAAPKIGGSRDRPDSARVATVEHLLAAIYALEIENIRIEVSGTEIPVMDGSAAPFVALLRSAGREEQEESRRPWIVKEAFEIRDGDRSIRVLPADHLTLSYTIDFDHPCIGRQVFEMERLTPEAFERDLAPARTFGFEHELEALSDAGLAKGGTLDNAIVLGDSEVLNEGGLRWPDEFVRHKMIDLIGDLALLGARPLARIEVEKGGHRLHHELVRKLLGEGTRAGLR